MTDSDTAPRPTDLRQLHTTPTIAEYSRQIWDRRQYAVTVPLRSLRARNLNNVLGIFWFLLNPLLLVAVYYIFFGLVLGTNRGVDNFMAFLSAGVFTYTFLQRSMTSISRTMVTNVGLIRAIRFPRAILPISETIEQTLSHVPVIIALLALSIATGETPQITWLLFPLLVVLQAGFALGVGFILARIVPDFRDMQNLLPFVFRLIFYMSGVLYSVEQFVDDPTLRRLFYLNPFYDHIELVRYALFNDGFPMPAAIGAVASCTIMIPIGFVLFRRGEPYGKA